MLPPSGENSGRIEGGPRIVAAENALDQMHPHHQMVAVQESPPYVPFRLLCDLSGAITVVQQDYVFTFAFASRIVCCRVASSSMVIDVSTR